MLDNILFFERPYRHFLCVDSLDQAVAAQAAAVLGGPLPWSRAQSASPAGWICAGTMRSGRRRRLLHSGFLNEMRGRVQTLFQAPLSADDIQVQGRRQLPGQRIGVHNDSPGLGDEGYRVVLQFTHDLSPEDGGLFNIHAGDDPEAICQSIRPYPNLAVGFEMGAQSYHSVTPPTRQPRAALIFNFWHQATARWWRAGCGRRWRRCCRMSPVWKRRALQLAGAARGASVAGGMVHGQCGAGGRPAAGRRRRVGNRAQPGHR